MIYIMVVMAEYFLDWMSENIRASLAKLRKDGRFLGNAPYGWRDATEEEIAAGAVAGIVRDEEQGRWVVQMKDWFLSGWGMPRTTQALHDAGVKSPKGKEWWREGTVRAVLNNPAHCGKMEIPEVGLLDIVGVEPYYSEAVYFQIRELFRGRAAKGPATVAAIHYLLNDQLTCKHCGGPMRGRRHNQRGQLYYRCVAKGGQRTALCASNSKQTDLIEQCVLAAIRRFAERPDVRGLAEAKAVRMLRNTDTGIDKRIKQLRADLRTVDQDIQKWTRDFRDSRLDRDVYVAEANRLAEHKRQLEEALATSEQQALLSETRTEQEKLALDRLTQFPRVWERLDLEQRRQLVGSLVSQVIVGKLPDGDTEVEVRVRLGPATKHIIPKLHGARGELSLKQLAHLELHHRGLGNEEIADVWQITMPRVRSAAAVIRRQLDVPDLATAYEQQRDQIEKYLDYLPLDASARKRKGGDRKTYLTEAQQRVLRLRAQGRRGPAIAKALAITPGAVYKHLHDIRGQLGVDTDEAAVTKAAQWGLVDLEKTPEARFTPREAAYVYLRSTGLTDGEIAAEWAVSIQNVIHQRNAVLDKAQCQSTEELLTDKRGLVPSHPYGLPLGPLPNRKRPAGELSDKTLTVLRLIAQGLSYRQIAAQCGIQQCSVDHHVRRAKTVLGVATTAEAVEETRRRGLIR